jgi:hypothetical protein
VGVKRLFGFLICSLSCGRGLGRGSFDRITA